MLRSRFLPAGVPRGLLRMRERIGQFFSGAPIFFIGVVLGVALLFRVGIDAIRPASAETETATRETKQHARGSALGQQGSGSQSGSSSSWSSHSSPSSASSPTQPRTSSAVATPSTASVTADPSSMSTHTNGGPAPAPARRKPKNHGKR